MPDYLIVMCHNSGCDWAFNHPMKDPALVLFNTLKSFLAEIIDFVVFWINELVYFVFVSA